MAEGREPIERLEFEARDLMAEFPPVLRDRNKRVVFGIACPAGCIHSGHLVYSRWREMRATGSIDVAGALERLEGSEDLFDYPEASGPGEVVWNVNFADPNLFVAYGSPLFAQDEMQVAEHPALGALREAVSAQGLPAVTLEGGRPTPVLVTGVERRCRWRRRRAGFTAMRSSGRRWKRSGPPRRSSIRRRSRT